MAQAAALGAQDNGPASLTPNLEAGGISRESPRAVAGIIGRSADQGAAVVTMEPAIRAFVEEAEIFHAESQAPGMAIGVAVDGEPVHTAGLGFSDAEHQVPMTPDTVLGIGSITKSFTCVAVMQLQERGRLAVDDPVVKYLPGLRLPGVAEEQLRRITIAHLMTHTSGLPLLPLLFHALVPSLRSDPSVAWHRLPADPEQTPPILTLDDLLAALASGDVQLLGEPGSWFSYSNEGYALLGAVIEAASDQPYEEYVTEHILRPAGMDRSSFIGRSPARADGPITQLYSINPETGRPGATPGWWYSAPFSAAGFLRSTVHDMLRYLEVFRTGGMVGDERILQPGSVEAMTSVHFSTAPRLGYGYGLHVWPDYHGLKVVEHGGGIKGTAAWVSCVRERGLTFVVLSNLGGVTPDRPVTGALNELVGLPRKQMRVEAAIRNPAVAADPAQLAACAGTYVSGEGPVVQLTLGEEGLSFSAGPVTAPLRPAGPGTFVVPAGSGSLLRVHRGPGGAVDRISLGWPAGFRVFVRA